MRKIVRKFVAISLVSIMLFALLSPVSIAAQERVTANPTSHVVEVNGTRVFMRGYLINGNNFFMLRDIAFVLTGLVAQFDVAWDGDLNAINIIQHQAYTPVGGEFAGGISFPEIATPSTSDIFLNGVTPIDLRAYNIGGNNFFMLRDVAGVIGFDLEWNETTGVISVTSPALVTYQQILDYFSARLNETALVLVQELKAQAAASTGGLNQLSELYFSKLGVLSEISAEGAQEMAALMLEIDGDIDTYTAYVELLNDVHLATRLLLGDAYMELRIQGFSMSDISMSDIWFNMAQSSPSYNIGDTVRRGDAAVRILSVTAAESYRLPDGSMHFPSDGGIFHVVASEVTANSIVSSTSSSYNIFIQGAVVASGTVYHLNRGIIEGAKVLPNNFRPVTTLLSVPRYETVVAILISIMRREPGTMNWAEVGGASTFTVNIQ